MGKLKLTSSAFKHDGKIPDKYTCKGDDISPNLKITGISKEAKSLALIMDDPDAPVGTWDHWVVWNIPIISEIKENSLPSEAVQGINSWGRNSYGGPCPPSGTHRYFFKLYALNKTLNLSGNSKKEQLESAMKGHVIAKTQLVGLYSK